MIQKSFARKLGVSALTAVLLALPATASAFELNGFGDISYTTTEPGGVSNNGFALGQLDFYATQEIDDRVDVLAEYVIESPGEGFVVDLERLQIGYALGDHSHIRAGRFHNLIGYWNTAYHHGAQLHTTIGRPFFLEFEDENGIIPVHAVGLWWDNRFDTGAGRIDLGVMFGNGASVAADLTNGESGELNPGSSGDSDNDKAVSWNLRFHPSAVDGLAVGFSGQVGTIRIHDTNPGSVIPDDKVDQTLLAFDMTFRNSRAEFLSEYYMWSNDSEQAATTFDGSTGYYVQAGYRVGDHITPYARYEMLDAETDPLFDAVGMTWDGTVSANRQKSVAVAGFRYDLNFRSALKVEYRAVDDDVDGAYNEGAVQWSFAF